jgi:exodeoxyribonuclease VIII
MLDLETLSSAPDAAIVAIGACTFAIDDPNFIRSTLSVAIDARSSQHMGGRIDGDTVSWWLGQPERARSALLTDRKKISDALLDFVGWVKRQSAAPRIWGNGATFDNVILRQTFERANIDAPWSHRDDRCYRTLKNLRPDIEFVPYGTHHNALDDAFAQASHAERILAAMKGS